MKKTKSIRNKNRNKNRKSKKHYNYNSKSRSKSPINTSKNYQKKLNKSQNSIKSIKSIIEIMKGGSKSREELEEDIKALLPDIEESILNTYGVMYYNTPEHQKDDKYAQILTEISRSIENIPSQSRRNQSRGNQSRRIQSRGRHLGAAAAATDTSTSLARLNIAGQNTFTIVTTGIADWGRTNNIIKFFSVIMDSLINNTFNSSTELIVYHYDKNLTDEQSQYITSTFNRNNIINIVNKSNLDPEHRDLQSLDRNRTLHLDFANLDADSMFTDNFLPGIKKVYFGYWEGEDSQNPYTEEYEQIIRGIKLVDVFRHDSPPVTYIDKIKALIQLIQGAQLPIQVFNRLLLLFQPMPDCNGKSKKIISILGLRTIQYNDFGTDPRDIFTYLWELPPAEMRDWIIQQNRRILGYAKEQLEVIYRQRSSNKCEFCPIRRCYEERWEFSNVTTPPLCSICSRLITQGNVNMEALQQAMNIPADFFCNNK